MNSQFKTILFVFLVLCFVASGSTIFAQHNFNSKSFTTDHGLANNWLQSICQDKTGFLWIATWDGLSRYDGFEFKNYYSYSGNSVSLPYFLIDKVITDKFNNVIAFSNERPIYIYNRASDCFERFNINNDPGNVSCNDIDKDSQENLWILAGGSLYTSDCATAHYSEIKVVDKKMNPFILWNKSRISVDNTGEIWFYEVSGSKMIISRAVRLNDSVFMAENINPLSFKGYKSLELHSENCISVFKSKNGNTWLMSKYGLFHFKTEKKEFSRWTLPVNPEEFSGRPFFTWIDDMSGINIIDTEKKQHYNIPAEPGSYFETVFIDNDNTIWAGTINSSGEKKGLKMYIRPPDYFTHFLTDFIDIHVKKQVTGILKDKFDNIWVALKNQRYLLCIKPDGRTNKVRYLDHFTGKEFPIVKTMIEDSGGIWLGCTNSHLIYYDYSTRIFTPKINSPPIIRDKSTNTDILNIFKSNEKIIINGNQGVFSYSIPDDDLKLEYTYLEKGIVGFTMNVDKAGEYWIGFHTGSVVHLTSDFKEDTIFRFGQRQEIAGDICPGNDNDIWVAFQGSGLGHLFTNDLKYETYTTLDGLSNNVVISVLQDKSGNLWLSTNKGISHFNPKTRQFRNFDKEDGLLIEEFINKSRFITQNDEIFFGGVGGLVSFNPDEIIGKSAPNYPLLITDIVVSGKTAFFKKAVYESDTIILKKGDNNFHASFTCLNLKNDKRIKYRYRLIGSSLNWTETDRNNRNILFLNLSPGNYDLEIEATDLNGNWSSKASLIIIIPFRIIETLWFKILTALFAFSIIAGLVITYIKQINLKAKQAQDDLRHEALRAQMNPHFIFNSLNSINYFVLKNDKISANKYIVDFSRLIRAFLTNLSGDYVLLETEIQMLRDYLNMEKMRFSDKFTYSINLNELEYSQGIQIFPGIIQPFVENAIWHGISGIDNRTGHISVTLHQISPRHIKCIIEDDGIGRKQTSQYRNDLTGKKSRGTGIVLERLNMFNNRRKTSYHVQFEDLYPGREETGTRVIVDIPVNN